MSESSVAELLAEVRKLEGTNSANTRTVKDLQSDIKALDGRLAQNTRQLRKRTRNTLVLLLLVAVLLAGLTVAGIYAASYFSCRNNYTEQFLTAEHDKVAGQIQG